MGRPYDFLDKTIRILIGHPNPSVRNRIFRDLSSIPLHDITVKSDLSFSDTVFLEKRIHLCIVDCDERRLPLFKRYRNVSFVAVVDKGSPFMGFLYSKKGVKDVIEYGSYEETEALDKFNHYAFLNIINPFYAKDTQMLNIFTEALFKDKPDNVTEWAMGSERTARQLSNVYRPLQISVKVLHFIFTLYNQAFSFYSTKKISKNYNSIEEYFHTHRSTILKYINRAVV